MAAPSNKLTAVHFSLIVFVMSTIIAVVVMFFYMRDYETVSAELAEAKKDVGSKTTALTTRDNELEAAKKLMGIEFESMGLDEPDNPNTVLNSLKQTMGQTGGMFGQPTVTGTMMALRRELDSRIASLQAQSAEYQALYAKYQALENEKQQAIAQHGGAQQRAESDLQARIKDTSEIVDAKDREIARLRDDFAKTQIELEQARDRIAAITKDKNQAIENLEVMNARLTEDLDALRQTSFEVPDGLLRWVDNASGLVYLNVGEADGLPVRSTFSVYEKYNHGVGRGKEDIKGSVEVTRILGPHEAEARILPGGDLYRPMAPGDVVYSPLWSPGLLHNFSFIGIIDLDGDGVSDRKLLHDLVQNAGAKIDNEVDEQGELHGDGLGVDTKFLVVGKIPAPDTVPPGEDREKILKISSMHRELVSQARQRGVRVVNLDDFLAFVGYVPKRRLFVPGNPQNKYTLKAGARSTSVDEAGGDRTSAGAVSEVFSKNRRLGQKTSMGHTSKLYGEGGK